MATCPHIGDAELVRQVLSGNRDIFGLLVERYLPMVHALVRANLGAWGDIDDIAQDSFLSAFNSLDKLRHPEKFAGWLATITRHECVRHAKDRKRFARNEVAWRAAAPTFMTDDPGQRELHAMLEQTVRDLDVQHREILLLYYFSKKDMSEIESALDISRETAKKRLQRARAALESHIASQVGDLLVEYAPRKEDAAKVMGAIAFAQPAWLLTSDVGAASALTVGSTIIMKAKTLTAIGVAVILAGLGIVTYTYSQKGSTVTTAGDSRPLAEAALPREKPSTATADTIAKTTPEKLAAKLARTSAPESPAHVSARATQSKRSGMVGGNPQRTGFYDVPAPLTQPTVRWAAEMNGIPGTMPAIDGQGRIFLNHGDTRGPDWLSAFTPKGELLWEFGPVDRFRSTGSPAITPDGRVIFAFNDRVTRAFDPETGAIAWSAELADRETLIDSKGNLYTTSRSGFEKIDSATGLPLWDAVPRISAPAALSLDGRAIYARSNYSDDGLIVKFALQSISAEDGALRWSFSPDRSALEPAEMQDDFLGNWATPIVGSDGTVFIQDAAANVLYALRDNGDSASTLWEYWPASAYEHQPFNRDSGEFYIYNGTGDSPRLAATDGEAVYMGVYGNYSFGGYPASVHAVGMNGEPLWHTFLEGDMVAGSTVVTNDAVYVLGGGNEDVAGTNDLYCLDRDNGEILWQMNVSPPHGDVGESIALAPDGTIYVATTGPDGEGSILRALR